MQNRTKKTSNTLKSCRTNCLKVSRKQRLESWQTGLVRFIFLLNLCPSQETDLRRDITGTCQNNTFSVSTLLLLILLCRISFFCVNSTGVDSSVSVLLCRFSFFCVNSTGADSARWTRSGLFFAQRRFATCRQHPGYGRGHASQPRCSNANAERRNLLTSWR